MVSLGHPRYTSQFSDLEMRANQSNQEYNEALLVLKIEMSGALEGVVRVFLGKLEFGCMKMASMLTHMLIPGDNMVVKSSFHLMQSLKKKC